MRKRILTLLLSLAMCLGLSAPAFAAGDIPFTDVPAEAWYRSDVAAAHATGLLVGTGATTFGPGQHLTLAQAVTLAARVHQYAAEGKTTLVNGAEIWYSTFVDYAKKNGIIDNSYDDRWGQDATRAEMVKILYRALPAEHYQVINDVEDGAIPDVQPSYDCGPEVYAFYRAGILVGSRSTYKNVINVECCFKPQEPIARCEVAAILNRMLNPGQRRSLTLSLPELPAANAAVTEANVFALLDNLDPDGAWIIRNSDSYRDGSFTINGVEVDAARNFMGYFVTSINDPLGKAAGNNLETAVHEELHNFTSISPHYAQDICTEKIYTGDGEYITINCPIGFKTEEMSKLLPESLRTGRYNTYVSEGSRASANLFGAAGLLDEFAAYCWGFNDSVRTSEWRDDVQFYSNGFVSYAEFRFYILSYMLYARENYPDVYQEILNNDAYRQAFTTIDAKFSEVVEEFCSMLQYPAVFQGEYDSLTAVMERPEYVEMANLLKP